MVTVSTGRFIYLAAVLYINQQISIACLILLCGIYMTVEGCCNFLSNLPRVSLQTCQRNGKIFIYIYIYKGVYKAKYSPVPVSPTPTIYRHIKVYLAIKCPHRVPNKITVRTRMVGSPSTTLPVRLKRETPSGKSLALMINLNYLGKTLCCHRHYPN